MIFDKKGLKGNNFVHLVLAAVLILGLVGMVGVINAIATGSILNGNGSSQNYGINYTRYYFGNNGSTINEDKGYIYNITVNNTANSNVTGIFVYLWGHFDFSLNFRGDTAGSNNSFNISTAATAVADRPWGIVNFSNTTDVNAPGAILMWNSTINATTVYSLLPANQSTNGSTISFNATASTPGLYNITVRLYYNTTNNNTGVYNETNISILVNDTTAPGIVNFSYNLSVGEIQTPSYANISGSVVINISVVDNGNFSLTMGTGAREITYVNVTVWNASDGNTGGNGSSGSWFSASNLSAFAWNGNYWNVTIDTTKFPDGVYNISIWANDSNNNFNSTNISLIRFDNTAPTASVSCSPATVNTGDTVTCTCSPSDSGSGVNTSATTVTANPSTTNTGTFTETCTFADLAGKTGTASDTYTVEQSSSGASTSSGSTSSSKTTTTTAVSTAPSAEKERTLEVVSPSEPGVIENFDGNTGVKEIRIEVNSEAQDVAVNVKKYDSRPAEVSVEKTGKTYTYLQIETTNLEDKLSKATVMFQVEKSWVSGNALAKDDVLVFKFDGTQWNELPTTYSSEDDNFYYYSVDVTSFSYFAIGEKAVVEAVSEGGAKKSLTWAYVVVAVAVIAAVAWFVWKRKK